jgi:hypothetical protein
VQRSVIFVIEVFGEKNLKDRQSKLQSSVIFVENQLSQQIKAAAQRYIR